MKTNVSKTVLTMIMAAIVMIGMTGIGAATISQYNTKITYDGDGEYECDYDATETGNITICNFSKIFYIII